jgi:hypothetical protein
MRLVLSMGLKPHGDPREPLRPRLRLLDTDTGRVEDLLAPEPGPHHPAEAEHAELTGAFRVGDVLLQCTRTEVLELGWGSWELRHRWSHPLLHDVHHALPYADGVAVASTGLDAVLCFDAERRLVARHWLGEGDFEQRFGGVTDHRTLPFDHHKPHQVHPNHLLTLDGALYATCLQTRELRRVTPDPAVIWRFSGPPHDGRWLQDAWWFTTVDGQIVALDATLTRPVLTIDLAALHEEAGLIGWCRGIERVGDRLFVGMTMLRATPGRELVRRLVRGAHGRKLPTRVIELDLQARRIVRSHPVGNEAGGTLYAIHALD